MGADEQNVEFLIVDTSAFIQNAPLHNIGKNILTCKDVVDEITNKRQLRRLVVLPYDLIIKDVFPENIAVVTEFAKKTGDYPSLSATDIKVMALTYQMHKEKHGIEGIRTEPIYQTSVKVVTKSAGPDMTPDISGFFVPSKSKKKTTEKETLSDEEVNISEQMETLECVDEDTDESENEEGENDSGNEQVDEEEFKDCLEVLQPVQENENTSESEESSSDNDPDDDDAGWITPSNVKQAKKQVNSQLMEEKTVTVACMTTDFAMQNVLKQMNLNVSALDGRIIKQLRTFILRCYTCFKTTSLMTKKFCPKCGNSTLKKVAVSLDAEGKMQIHINGRRPLTARGKKFSLPMIRGGKHPNNPILVEDQPMADNRPTRLARTKTNPLDDDYIAGFSPFVMRDVNSKSAQLCIRPGQEMKHWMKKNPNEARRKRK